MHTEVLTTLQQSQQWWEYSTRHGIHSGFIWDCFLHVYWILLWHPGKGNLDPARAWCSQVSWLHAGKAHLFMAAMLKRNENRTVGNKKTPRSNRGFPQTDIRPLQNLPINSLWRPAGLQLPIKVICVLPLHTASFCAWEPSLGRFVGSMVPHTQQGSRLPPAAQLLQRIRWLWVWSRPSLMAAASTNLSLQTQQPSCLFQEVRGLLAGSRPFPRGQKYIKSTTVFTRALMYFSIMTSALPKPNFLLLLAAAARWLYGRDCSHCLEVINNWMPLCWSELWVLPIPARNPGSVKPKPTLISVGLIMWGELAG